ncbi:hypothetical protein FHS43_001807 [Streptosporangium becharense]|uniref:Lipoprotein n=1 Tax=Streptosporangium becharense TaxID=1816182 RepID=A0A7W9MJJ3_9ACTN|nr:hypothetical protein [Streptosporangium becharense]MBB2910544.1 hypothetical protein [Streptosporangium becharense]MBB5823287.1 hypothetical protein [Streptosporangium becharense]
MPVSVLRRICCTLLLASSTMVLTACGSQTSWWRINIATLSLDGLTLTAELAFGEPKADGTHCEKVTDTEVVESPSQVILGVRVLNSCAPSFPWDQRNIAGMEYSFPVKLKLKEPLAGRVVLDRESGLPVKVEKSNNEP